MPKENKEQFAELKLLMAIEGDGALEFIKKNPATAVRYIEVLTLESQLKMLEVQKIALHMARVISMNDEI